MPDRISIPQLNLNPQLLYRFNAAAWSPSENANTFLMAREVHIAGGQGEPDKGDMVLLEVDAQGKVIQEKVIWKLEGASQLLEDARAFVCKDGKVLLGLTAVTEENGKATPYPAVVTLDNAHKPNDQLPQVQVLKQFGPGKNMTPLDDHGTFLFRQDSPEHHHHLLVFSWDGEHEAQVKGQVQFPTDIPWAQWRTGTTMPPIWINDHQALMIFHGITKQDGKYIYTLGRALLNISNDDAINKKYTVQVDYNPLVTPDDFLDDHGRSLVEELHPHLRRVVYACGGVLRRVENQLVLALYVNVGDRQTVEVQLPWKELLQFPY